MREFEKNESRPRVTEKFWSWIGRVRPDLMAYVSRQFHSDAEREAYLVGLQIGREGAFFDEQIDKGYTRLAHDLTRKFDFSDYLLPGCTDLDAARTEAQPFPKQTCRRCGETPMFNGIVTIRHGRPDHTSALCESCIAELGDDADPPEAV